MVLFWVLSFPSLFSTKETAHRSQPHHPLASTDPRGARRSGRGARETRYASGCRSKRSGCGERPRGGAETGEQVRRFGGELFRPEIYIMALICLDFDERWMFYQQNTSKSIPRECISCTSNPGYHTGMPYSRVSQIMLWSSEWFCR